MSFSKKIDREVSHKSEHQRGNDRMKKHQHKVYLGKNGECYYDS